MGSFDRSFYHVIPGDEIRVQMPARDALLTVVPFLEVSGIVTEGGSVKLHDGTILPLPSNYRLALERFAPRLPRRVP